MRPIDPATVVRAQAGDRQATEALMARMEPLVRSAARKMSRGSTVPMEDMIQEAWAGVFEALQTFDPDKGSFESWAFAPMRRGMVESYPGYVSGPSVPRGTAEKYASAMASANGDPSVAMGLAREAGMAEETFAAAHAAFSGTYSTSAFSDSEADRFEIEAEGDSFQDLASRLETEAWLSHLPEREAFIVAAYVGLGGEPMTDSEIAEALSISQPMVHRIRTRALLRLRRLAEEALRDA